MATRNSKAHLRVRKTKTTIKTLERQHNRFKQALIYKLAALDDDLTSSIDNHSFLHNSMLTLAGDALDIDYWLSGARAHCRWLRQSDRRIAGQLQDLRRWVDQ